MLHFLQYSNKVMGLAMGIKVRWKTTDQTVLVIEFDGQWSWEEYAVVQYEQINPMLDTVAYSVYHIYDFTNTQHTPTNTLTWVPRLPKIMHSRFAEAVFLIGVDPFIRKVLQVAEQTYLRFSTLQFFFVDTQDEALALIYPDALPQEKSFTQPTTLPSISITWYDETQRCLIWRFNYTWTYNEYMQAVRHSNALISQKPYSVDVICDLSNYTTTANNVLSMARQGLQQRPPNLGHVVIITQSRFWLRMYHMLIQHKFLSANELHITQNMNEAYHFLNQALHRS